MRFRAVMLGLVGLLGCTAESLADPIDLSGLKRASDAVSLQNRLNRELPPRGLAIDTPADIAVSDANVSISESELTGNPRRLADQSHGPRLVVLRLELHRLRQPYERELLPTLWVYASVTLPLLKLPKHGAATGSPELPQRWSVCPPELSVLNVIGFMCGTSTPSFLRPEWTSSCAPTANTSGTSRRGKTSQQCTTY